MKLNINSDRPFIIDTLVNYMNDMLVGKKVEAVINGRKYEGVVSEAIYKTEQDPYTVLIIKIDDVEEKIPVLPSSKTAVRIMKALILLETESHHTLIEVLN